MLPHPIEHCLDHHLLNVSCHSSSEARVLAVLASLVTTERSKIKQSEWSFGIYRSEPTFRKSDFFFDVALVHTWNDPNQGKHLHSSSRRLRLTWQDDSWYDI